MNDETVGQLVSAALKIEYHLERIANASERIAKVLEDGSVSVVVDDLMQPAIDSLLIVNGERG